MSDRPSAWLDGEPVVVGDLGLFSSVSFAKDESVDDDLGNLDRSEGEDRSWDLVDRKDEFAGDDMVEREDEDMSWRLVDSLSVSAAVDAVKRELECSVELLKKPLESPKEAQVPSLGGAKEAF
mmetsp:Transcript_40605/g.98062  ORF Transcript_40605/g.98062 Transcript_40605/m.98062 type:complete len:123 (-) Transcript_40605:535-903(-)